jgi:hypothetical protein
VDRDDDNFRFSAVCIEFHIVIVEIDEFASAGRVNSIKAAFFLLGSKTINGVFAGFAYECIGLTELI